MDLATLIGLLSGIIVITMAVLSDGSAEGFINAPGLMIVLGGTFAATLIKFSIRDCLGSFLLGLKTAFVTSRENPAELIHKANELAAKVRKSSVLALDGVELDNHFFKKGIQLCVDGKKPEYIRKLLSLELKLSVERHELGQKVFRSIGDTAPAFGMIGTLVGLIQMLGKLNDPSAIGPGMAVALLTTLYGALIANLVAIPIADKLQSRTSDERLVKSLIMESVLSIQQGENPRAMDELLEAYLSNKQKQQLQKKSQATETGTGHQGEA